MSVLSEAFPGYINSFIEASSPDAAATAIYSEFTSGSVPQWFSTLPYDAKSFLVLDFIPNYRRDRSMTLRVLGETTTTTTSHTTASPGSTPIPGPTSTTSSSDADWNGNTQTSASNSNRTAVIVGSVVGGACLLAVALAVVLVWLHRKRRTQNYNATPLYHTEPEDGTQNKYFGTPEDLPAQMEPRHQEMVPSNLPEVDMSPVFGGDLRVLKRRSRSATDLRGWTSWPGLGHGEVPDLPPRSTSAMSVRIVRPDE